MTQVELHEVEAKLAHLVERAEAGEDIVIARNGTPIARLVPVATNNTVAAVHGTLRGRVHFAGDVDELPDDIAEPFGAG